MYNKSQLSRDFKAAKEPKKLARPKDKTVIPGAPKVDPNGYWDPANVGRVIEVPLDPDSQTITMSYPDGTSLDQPLIGVGTDTGMVQYMMPGQDYLWPNDSSVVEHPTMEDGGEYMDLDEDEIAAYRAGGYVVEELPKAQKGNFGYFSAPKPTPINEINLPAVTVKPKSSGHIVDPRPEYSKGYYDPFGVPDNTLENIAEIFEPTGISSWDDIVRAEREYGKESWQANLERLGAVPLIGKVSKTLKGLKGVPMSTRQRNSFNTTLKTLQAAGLLGRGSDTYQAIEESKKEDGGVYSEDITYPPKHNPANSFAVTDPRSMQPGGGVKYTVDPRNPNVRIYNDKYAYNLAKKAEQDSSAAYYNYRNNVTPPAFTYDERNWAGMKTGNKVKPKPSDKDVKHIPASVGQSMVRNKYTWQGIQNNADRMDDYDYKCYEGDPRVCEKGLVPEFRGIKPSGYDVIDWTYPTGNKSRAVVSVFDKPKIKNIYKEPVEPTPPSKGQKSPQTTAKVKTSNESKPYTEFNEHWGNNTPNLVKVDYPTKYSIKEQRVDENGNMVTETIYYDKPQVDKLPFRPLPNVTYPSTPDLNLPKYELIKRYNQDQNKWIADEALSNSPEAQQYRAAENWRLQNPQTRTSSHAVTQEEKQAYEDRKNRIMQMMMGITGAGERITQNKLNTLDLQGKTFAEGGSYNIGDEVDEDTYLYLKSIGYEFE